MKLLKLFKFLFMFHVKHSVVPDDGGAADPADPPADSPADPPEVTRPENVPEKFWDAEAKTIKVDDVIKSYTELETKIGTTATEAVEAYKTEQKKGLPGSPQDYQIELPNDILPEGQNFNIADDDKMVGWFREFAHQRGMSQLDFTGALRTYIENDIAQGNAIRGQMDQLGENGQDRVDRIDMFLQKTLNSDVEYKAMANIINSPNAVIAMEKLMDTKREPDLFKGPGNGDDGKITREQVREMMDDPRYWKTKDAEYIKKVQGFYDKLYPGQQKKSAWLCPAESWH